VARSGAASSSIAASKQSSKEREAYGWQMTHANRAEVKIKLRIIKAEN